MKKMIFAILACALSATMALAQSGGPYELTWSTTDTGGGTDSSGGTYTLGGTAGQPDAGFLSGGTYELLGGFWFGGDAISAVGDEPPQDGSPAPLVFRLYEAAPNPFNPRTKFAFDLPEAATVHMAVYDVRGFRVRTLASEPLPVGHHVIPWDGTDDTGASVASGPYFVVIDAGQYHAARKSMLLK